MSTVLALIYWFKFNFT